MASINQYLDAFPTRSPTPHELFNTYADAFYADVRAGNVNPLIFPQFLTSFGLLFAYLCIPHTSPGRRWLYHARLPLFAYILRRETQVIGLWGKGTSSLSMGTGFGVGLLSCWCVVACAIWLIWEDPQRTARRVERRRKYTAEDGHTNGDAVEALAAVANGGEGSLRQRNTNGHAQNGGGGAAAAAAKTSTAGDSKPEWEYFWQGYPEDNLTARLSWVLDLVLNFRGPGWSWEIPTNPGLPAHVLQSLGEPVSSRAATAAAAGVSAAGIVCYSFRREVIRAQGPRLVAGYLVLDCLKVVLMRDPFFVLGPNDYALPPHLAWLHPLALDVLRKLLCCAAVTVALEFIFLLAPLAFCILLGPAVLGVRGEPWMYPSTWGRLAYVGEKGLAGLWGGWWHQTFRKGFSAPSDFLVRRGYLAPSSTASKLVGLFLAFSISGMVHAAGSCTALPRSKPLELLLFFQLQGLGIALQTLAASRLRPLSEQLPRWLRRAANFAVALAWLYCTSGYLVADFSRSIWLIEPIPFSLVRGLGLGYPEDGWVCRSDPFNLRWHTGKHWWDSGLAI